MDTQQIRKEYKERIGNFKRLKAEVLYILKPAIKEQNIPIHQITGRIKSFNSFVDKGYRLESDNPFETVNDLCGIRVICLFLSDIEKIDDILNSKFRILTKDDKVTSKSEDTFGYLSVHYIGVLPATCSGPRYEGLENLEFEIQLRTIAMHSWATVSHYLDYKSPHSIPSNLRKDFNALSALFYLADSHFELFFRASNEEKEVAIQKAKQPRSIEKEEINLNTLTAYLHQRYPHRKYSPPKMVSQLIEELQSIGYSKMQQLHLILDKSDKAFKEYEKKNPPAGGLEYYDVGVVRSSLLIADDKYRRYYSKKGDYSHTQKTTLDELYEPFRHLIS